MKGFISALGLVVLWPLAFARAQLYPPNEMGVSLGHWHTIVRDVEASKKFWIAVGGTPMKIDGTDVMKFSGVFIFLTPGTPSGGSEGTVVNHVGFEVHNRKDALAKWQAAGLVIKDGLLHSPDDLVVETSEEGGPVPYPPLPPGVAITSIHMHIHVPAILRKGMLDWYVKMFGARPGEYRANLTGAIPGAQFMRWTEKSDATLTTKGSTLDHIGFEVKNLEAFCKKLEADGVKLDAPYNKTRHQSFASAELTDPWRTSIELTEGLNRC